MNRDEWVKQYEHKKRIKRYVGHFKSYLANNLNGKFTLIGDYNGVYEVTEIRCNRCGFVIDNKTPLQFERNPICPICDPQAKQTEKSFIWRLQNVYGNQYTLLSPFINVDTFVYLYHKDCGHIIKMRPATLLSGSQCHYCYGTDKLGLVGLYKQVHSANKDLELVDGSIARNKVVVRYLSCGHIRKDLINGIKERPYCQICANTMDRRKRALGFARNIGMYGLVSLRSMYISQSHDVTVQCNRCGYTWDTNPGPLAVGHGCPKCSSSRGEAIIVKILDKYHIVYEYPKKFEDLRVKRLLHYDFYLPEYNVLIEYQGRQHYESVDYFGGDNKFREQQKHDEMKRRYAKEYGYHLLEISYKYDTLKSIERKIKNYLGGINHG